MYLRKNQQSNYHVKKKKEISKECSSAPRKYQTIDR